MTKFFKSFALSLGSVGLLTLGACGDGNQTANTASSPVASPSIAASPSNASPATSTTQVESGRRHSGEHGKPMQGGQVIESGPYHLELVTAKEATGTHIDFFLQTGDNHEAIPNAKVTAQVQLPDGNQRSLNMKYDAGNKHYTAILPASASGEYKVAILSDISGEKVNGRFSFKR